MSRFRDFRVGLRIAVVWISTAAALLLLSAILPGFAVTDPGQAMLAAAAIGLVNSLVWPLVIRFALPFTVLTMGLGALILNAAVVELVAGLDPSGLRLDGVGAALVVAIGITLVTTLVSMLLAIDDDGPWYRNVVARQARRVAPSEPSDVPGVYFLEIDGLAHDVLRRAMRDGSAPTLARWLRDGTHRFVRWETEWSSQTGSCQAGLLHGNNDDYPAFRWWEKDRGQAIVTNHPRDAAELERRHSNGRGLLHEDGASRANILSGDAPHSMLTMSTVLDRDRRGRIGQDYYAYFARPYSVVRTILLSLADVAQELYFAAQQRRRDVHPRIKRTFSYALMRAWATVVQRDLQVAAVVADLYAGRPVGYTTFLAYDEVAHHSGVERPDAIATLRRVDHQIARIAAAAEDAPREYRLVVLSDHGQSQGETFLDRYGISLHDLVAGVCEATATHSADGGGRDEAAGYLGAGLTEAAESPTMLGRSVRVATRGKRVDGEIRVDEDDSSAEGGGAEVLPELSTMASGCLGLISFPREPGRVSLERIEELHPKLIPTLREHPGIGFLLVRSERDGAVVLGRNGINHLDRGEVEGADPLAPFGPNAAAHVKRTDGFAHCADIMLNSTYWAESDEVAAFEELVGSHGGMGGEQSHPFAILPADWEQPEGIVGSAIMHRYLRGRLAALGHETYRDGSA